MEQISIGEAVRKIKDTDGKIFGVTFIKRTTGEVRTMSCRRGVTKGVKGVGLAFNPDEKNLLVVFDMNSKFRMINLDGLLRLQIAGEEWEILR